MPLYGIAIRLGLDRRVGLLFAGSYLLHPLLQTATLYDFHPDAFVPLFAAGSFWALLELDHIRELKVIGRESLEFVTIGPMSAYRDLPKLVVETGVVVRRVESLDHTLEAAFEHVTAAGTRRL